MLKDIWGLTIILISLTSCASSSSDQVRDFNFVTQVKQFKIHPGDVIKIELPKIDDEVELWCGKKQVPFYTSSSDEVTGYLSETYFSNMKPFSCSYKKVKVKKGEIDSKVIAQVVVEDKTFPHEFLKVAPKRVKLSAKDQKRVAKEQVILNRVYAEQSRVPLFEDAFRPPLTSKVTSYYGVRRTYNKHHKGQHLGTDYRASVGVPIPVANSGRVVLSQDLFYTGQTVIVEHGLGIFTIYGHLSKRNVKAGEMIPAGTIVGLAGATGRVSGPHLHWGVKVHGDWVDGNSLVDATQ